MLPVDRVARRPGAVVYVYTHMSMFLYMCMYIYIYIYNRSVAVDHLELSDPAVDHPLPSAVRVSHERCEDTAKNELTVVHGSGARSLTKLRYLNASAIDLCPREGG